MIKDLKMGVKMMRYSHNIKGNVALCIIFAMLGIAMLLVENFFELNNTLLGGYFVLCAGLFPEQAIYQMNISNLVLASPARKKMQTKIPVLIGGTGMLVMYLIMVLIYVIKVAGNAEIAYDACSSLVIVSVLMLGMMLYMAVAYKYFVASVFMFVFVYCTLLSGDMLILSGSVLPRNIFGNNLGSLALAAMIGSAVIVIAGFLSYLLSLLVYRAPLSKRAMPVGLRKVM